MCTMGLARLGPEHRLLKLRRVVQPLQQRGHRADREVQPLQQGEPLLDGAHRQPRLCLQEL
jgi:hypothetical protein